jgi:hypothetical protein
MARLDVRARTRPAWRLGWAVALVAALAGPAPGADALGRLLARFPKADLNGDGKLTPAELKA